jgi:hypothetical protein
MTARYGSPQIELSQSNVNWIIEKSSSNEPAGVSCPPKTSLDDLIA